MSATCRDRPRGSNRRFAQIIRGGGLGVLFGLASLACGQTADDFLKEGSALDAKSQNAGALVIFLKAEELAPNNADVLRLISKQYVEEMAVASDADKEALGEKALVYGKRAVVVGPKNAEAHLALAIVLGKVAFLKAPKERLEFSRQIKEETETSITLDPGNDLAWHVLGRWNYEVANLSPALKFFAEALWGRMPDASNEKALACFQKAMALNPGRLVNEAELGRTLAALGRKDEARAALKKALAMPTREKDDVETKIRAEKALAALD